MRKSSIASVAYSDNNSLLSRPSHFSRPSHQNNNNIYNIDNVVETGFTKEEILESMYIKLLEDTDNSMFSYQKYILLLLLICNLISGFTLLIFPLNMMFPSYECLHNIDYNSNLTNLTVSSN